MIRSAELKQAFLKHFIAWGHVAIPPFSVKSSRSELLFNNSGMSPLYNMFCNGAASRAPLCSIQKCVRLGGKHNDYLNIGTSKQHLSLFEMMGGFSFGNYSKCYAIQLVWEFLIRLGLSVNELIVTVHAADLDTARLWKRVVGSKCNVLMTYGEQNVWKVGDTGLCGACTEIHYVNGSELWEILNVVFITHRQHRTGCAKLKLNCIDIGIGLERMLSVLDGSFDVYSTDELKRISEDIWPNQELAFVNRILLDHIRCASVIIADGIVPANTGAGYVLRKLIRRCVIELLTARRELYALYDLIARFSGEQLARARLNITDVFSAEIKLCLKTINAGVIKLKRYGLISRCYNTFGVPEKLLSVLTPDLTSANRHMTITYYNRNLTASELLLKQANYLILSKTSLTGASAGQIGDQGVIIGIDFSFIANREFFNGKCVHKILLSVGASGECCKTSVYVIRNAYLFELSSWYHSSLHALTGVMRVSAQAVKVLLAKVSYFGFALDLDYSNIASLKQLIACVLDKLHKLTRANCWYVKCAKEITKFVSVNAFDLSFVEKCCGTHANSSADCRLCYELKQLAKNRLRIQARFDLSKPEAVVASASCLRISPKPTSSATKCYKPSLTPALECYYPLASAHSRLRVLWVNNGLNWKRCSYAGSLFVIHINLEQKALLCSPLVLLALSKTLGKLVTSSSLDSAVLCFPSHSDLSYSLLFVKSSLFLLTSALSV
ncbi:MAG: alanine--tRNA ligase-related protein [Candidatus Hodgkinia cicadicola]